MKMFLHELKNALWHKSNTVPVPGSPLDPQASQQAHLADNQNSRYQPLGMEGILDEDDDEDEDDDDEDGDDDEDDSNEDEEEDDQVDDSLNEDSNGDNNSLDDEEDDSNEIGLGPLT